ncbi:aminopeptidase N [Paracoccaceae bacterium GXU_MW_L88]
MRDAAPTITKLADYQPPAFLVETVHLTFRLDPKATRVIAKLRVVPNPARTDGPHDLRFDGRDLTLISASVNGKALPPEITPDESGLTVPQDLLPDGAFDWEAETEINPGGNTALEGLYMSNGLYTTQCEAQGFRRITFFPDRPDVMAVYTVRIEAETPVRLSNGNRVDEGDGFTEWHDPFPKPSYLFALVAGELEARRDRFTTRSGRDVALEIWVRKEDLERTGFAMESLKKSMTWDEQVYGREYDLDLFMIVAVDDFNAGAMENKGLNIFNAKYVLASPDTATDGDFEGIESVIAHEYFHNWTGNRITCRDWFQLSLKEGLTVYRDQCFTADMRLGPVKRISDVMGLRVSQFREDAGPLAHPVRPEAYQAIDNFYTATVYEKGAEVVRMLAELVGPEGYDKALALYFDRHDGEACTIEDWLKVFEDATGRDLTQFKLWYQQAGTPHLTVTDEFAEGRYTLRFTQSLRQIPGQPAPKPMHIPIRLAFFGENGGQIGEEQVFELTEETGEISIKAASRPVPSLLRGFSAPVTMDRPGGSADDIHLLAHDTDPFARWDAGNRLMRSRLLDGQTELSPEHVDALKTALADRDLAPAYRAQLLGIPSTGEVAQELARLGTPRAPREIHDQRDALTQSLAEALGPLARELYEENLVDGPYSPDPEDAGKRALTGRLLFLLTKLEPEAKTARAAYAAADNMTDQIAALTALIPAGAADEALKAFREQWQNNRLVMTKWFAMQARMSDPDSALDVAEALTQDAAFDPKNPNLVYSVIGAFGGGNFAGFNRADGKGYAWLADWLAKLDKLNPAVAARLSTAFEAKALLPSDLAATMDKEINRLLAQDGLSANLREMLSRLSGQS